MLTRQASARHPSGKPGTKSGGNQPRGGAVGGAMGGANGGGATGPAPSRPRSRAGRPHGSAATAATARVAMARGVMV